MPLCSWLGPKHGTIVLEWLGPVNGSFRFPMTQSDKGLLCNMQGLYNDICSGTSYMKSLAICRCWEIQTFWVLTGRFTLRYYMLVREPRRSGVRNGHDALS